MSSRLPRNARLDPDRTGWNFYLCVRKDVRVGKGGEYLALVLQDASGQVAGRVFEGVDRYKDEFDAGEFVRVEGRTSLHNGELQLVAMTIRRVHPAQDAAQGFREEDCVPSAPRPPAAMWAELTALVAGLADGPLRVLLHRILADHEAALREWPAALQIHHAYRGGLLEHVLAIAQAGMALARLYGAREDLVLAGALLHDIGKLQELAYDSGAVSYTRDGNLVGHIALGLVIVRDAARGIADFPDDLRAEVEHLVLSHHGSRDRGSPVEPKSVEAFILAAVDDLDARLHQVRQAQQEAGADPAFTPWHRRLGRVLYRGGPGGAQG
jgi:3'-5' exoribonuclease